MSDDDPALARIEAALSTLGAQQVPPLGWESRVLAAAKSRKRPRWWWLALPAVATAIALGVWLARPSASSSPLQLAVTVEQGGPLMRGATAHVGDTIVATTSGGAGHNAVWVYRDDRLVVACDRRSPCRVALAAPGDYTIVALTADSDLPTPSGGRLDEDVAAATRAGAQYRMEPVAVR